ncbi:methyltransferase domain-containing protein [Amycolatopsis sacchari]|uniref:methyltransferase domain-containing protein n=1 Tax=Amycolatopsis sacchari TaxID=115433 RepID=UPI003EBBECDB
MSIEDLALENASVDVAVSLFGVLQVGEPDRAVEEPARILRSGGVLVSPRTWTCGPTGPDARERLLCTRPGSRQYSPGGSTSRSRCRPSKRPGGSRPVPACFPC